MNEIRLRELELAAMPEAELLEKTAKAGKTIFANPDPEAASVFNTATLQDKAFAAIAEARNRVIEELKTSADMA